MNLLTSRSIPALALANKPSPGRKLVDLSRLGFNIGLAGADSHGYNQQSDVLVTQTLDGVDYNQMWTEFQQTIAMQNAERTKLIQLFTFPVSNPTESVSQLSGAKFERQTEYGEPRGVRQQPTSYWLGFSLEDYDIAVRYTFKYLANASASQVEALHGSVLEADNQNMFEAVMKALYAGNSNRTADINDQAFNVYGLYNGDGTVPKTYKSNTFSGSHTHYLTSGAATITSGDLDDLQTALTEHGYSRVNGVQQMIGVNSREGKVIRQFRIADGANYDFIPSQSESTALILDPGQSVSGGQPASFYRGMNVIGSYGEALIVEDDNFPPAYVVIIGTGGTENLNNPVGLREPQNASLRGLKLIKGPDNDYPLTDSFYIHSFGTGIRQRGGAAVMQITASSTYTPPTQYLY